MSSRPASAPYAVECSNLWKIYPGPADASDRIIAEGLGRQAALEKHGAFVAVKDVSFAIQEGEIFCVMGLSGSGKSTVLRHINRLIEPSSGSIRIGGSDIVDKSPAELRLLRSRTIGMVSQTVSLFPHRNVRYNVGYALKPQGLKSGERNRVADEKLALVQLQDWGDRYPHQLSGGMQQRVGLARALASDPKILLMDEPFSSLDPLIRRQLQDEFKKIWRSMRKSVLFITHDLEEAMYLGDRIAVMRDGEFVQVGRPEEIILSPADGYVADFVRSAPKLKFITGRHIMSPLPGSLDLDACPKCRSDTPLSELIKISLATEGAIIILDDKSAPIGHITGRSLLEAVRDWAAAA
jgi:glycine betaine/proline transport system ATP-binding protein